MSTRGHERTTRSRAAPTASRSASRSAPTRAGCVASAGTSRARRYPSRRIGSSTIFRGKSFSARPGTKTTSKARPRAASRSEEHTSELQSPDHLVCRLLLEKKKTEATRQPVAPKVPKANEIHGARRIDDYY